MCNHDYEEVAGIIIDGDILAGYLLKCTKCGNEKEDLIKLEVNFYG